ncbi:MAG: hypothetical protein J6X55_06370, partial [Victivallales bacterium]|nr:hypothetical protein [Victivallales bacterium]
TPIVWCWNHPDEQFRNTELTAQCRIRASRHATGQVYEVAIPWNLLNPFTMDRGKMGFNLVILDNDGYGVKHWMGITDGIAGGKDPSFYQPLHFQNPEKLALAGMKAGIPLLRLNTDVAVGDFPMDFTVAVMISETMVEPELIVNAGKRQFRNKVNKGFNALKFRLEPADLPSGALTIAATATAEGKAINTTEEKILVVTHDSLETRCQETLTATEKLKEAIRDLEKAGKNTSYFTNRTALAEYFVRMVRLDNDRKVINRQPKVGAKYQMIPVTQEYRRFICRRSIRNLDYCIQMLQDGMAEAYEIIQGKRPDRVVAPMPKKANVTIKDGGFQLDGREMFFLGPNTWSFHYTQLTDIAGAGMNFFDITGLNRNNSTNDLTPRVEEFNPNQFSALFNPNSIITAGELGLYFFGRQMAGSNYVDDLNKPDDLKKQTAANQVVWKFLASQPHMAYLVGHAESFAKDTKIPRFEKNVQEHLRKTFGTVEKMNATLGTTYHDFTDFRDGDRNGNPALRYEVFRMEQDWNLATLHKSSADRRAFWQKPLSSHMTTSHWTAWDILLDSADYEGIWKELDVIGYDAGVRYGSRRYAASWEAVLMMCDFARSVFPDKPIANNETHNFPINCSSDISGDFIYNAQMAEMLHGRNAGVMWKWEQDFHSPWGSYAFTRANCFHAASLAALDARRLASEIATFRSEPRQFALFYSIPSFSDPGYYIRLSNVYQGAFFHGMTPGFITERQLADTEWQTNCKLILVPDARRVSNASFQALERLMRSGVTVIRVGEQALAMDEYGRICPQRAATLSEMTTLPLQEPEQYFTAFGDIFQKQGLHGTRQVTSPDGKPLWALEYRASSDGRLLYVINWDKRKQEIKLPEGDWHELISDTPSPTTRIIAPLEVRIFKARR